MSGSPLQEFSLNWPFTGNLAERLLTAFLLQGRYVYQPQKTLGWGFSCTRHWLAKRWRSPELHGSQWKRSISLADTANIQIKNKPLLLWYFRNTTTVFAYYLSTQWYLQKYSSTAIDWKGHVGKMHTSQTSRKSYSQTITPSSFHIYHILYFCNSFAWVKSQSKLSHGYRLRNLVPLTVLQTLLKTHFMSTSFFVIVFLSLSLLLVACLGDITTKMFAQPLRHHRGVLHPQWTTIGRTEWE